MQALQGAVHEERLDGVAPMNRGPIPDDDQAAWDVTEPMRQKGDPVVSVDGPTLALEVERARGRDGADGRQMVAAVSFP
jgi:hypothetical protein